MKWQPAEDGSSALHVFTGLEFEPVAYFADEEIAEAAVEILRRALEDAILCERGLHRRGGRPSEKIIRERMQEPDEHPQHEPPTAPAILPMPQIPGACEMSETLDISTARARLNKLDRALAEHPVILITRYGRPLFAAVDSDYLEALTETVAILADPNAMPMLARSTEDIEHGRMASQEEVERELC